MVRVRLMSWEKVYVLPPSQPAPNVPKIRVRICIVDCNQVLDVDADWSDNPATLQANATQAVKQTLQAMYDEVRGEYEYDPVTNTLTKI